MLRTKTVIKEYENIETSDSQDEINNGDIKWSVKLRHEEVDEVHEGAKPSIKVRCN